MSIRPHQAIVKSPLSPPSASDRTLRTTRPKIDPLRPFAAVLTPYEETIIGEPGAATERTVFVRPGKDSRLTVALKPNASLSLLLVAFCGTTDDAKASIDATVGAGASFSLFVTVRGGSRLEGEVLVKLTGEGANASVVGAFHGRGEEHHGFHVRFEHASPHTTGNIFLRGVYEDNSRGLFTGLLKVARKAQGTDTYFRDDILLLDDSLAQALPTLEIEANDVRASHGSTTSRLDDEQRFYLESRGLQPAASRQLIVDGFLESALSRFPAFFRSVLEKNAYDASPVSMK